MNITGFSSIGSEVLKKSENNSKSIKIEKNEKTNTADSFQQSKLAEDSNVDISQIIKFAESSANIREDKISEVQDKISNNFYTTEAFAEELSLAVNL